MKRTDEPAKSPRPISTPVAIAEPAYLRRKIESSVAPMKMFVEHACENCGAELIKRAALKVDDAPPKAADSCDECGHVTHFTNTARFQWPPSLKSMVDRLCNPVERRKLRLAPEEFVAKQLHAKLRALGKPPVEIDTSSTPITIRFK